MDQTLTAKIVPMRPAFCDLLGLGIFKSKNRDQHLEVKIKNFQILFFFRFTFLNFYDWKTKKLQILKVELIILKMEYVLSDSEFNKPY